MANFKLVLMSFLVVFLAACGGGNDNSPTSNNTPNDLSGNLTSEENTENSISDDADSVISETEEETEGSAEDVANEDVEENGDASVVIGVDETAGDGSDSEDPQQNGDGNDGATAVGETEQDSTSDTGNETEEEVAESGSDDHYKLAQPYFEEHVQPTLDYCRLCHVPAGVADVDDGRRFILLPNSSLDFGLVYASWKALGRGVQENPILTYNSDSNEYHTGGKVWYSYLPIYEQVVAVFNCWENAECDFE